MHKLKTGEVVIAEKKHMWGVLHVPSGEVRKYCTNREQAREWKNCYLDLSGNRGEFRIVRAMRQEDEWEVAK